MPFRADDNALKARKEALERALREIREAQARFDALKKDEAARVKELAEVQNLLKTASAKRALPLLDNMRIAAPCHVPWDDMVGDEHVRFCESCEKNVYDLSALTPPQAEALLREKEGNLCVTYFQRKDGTVLTADCPVGLRRRRLRNALVAIASVTSVGAAAFGTVAFGSMPSGSFLPIHEMQIERVKGAPSPWRTGDLSRGEGGASHSGAGVETVMASVVVLVEPKGASVEVDGQPRSVGDTGAIGFVGSVGSVHAITVSFGGRSITENIVIAPEDGHHYKIAL